MWQSSANTLPFAGPLSPGPVEAGLAFDMLLWTVKAVEIVAGRGGIRDRAQKGWIEMQGWIWMGYKCPKLGAAALASEQTVESKEQRRVLPFLA